MEKEFRSEYLQEFNYASQQLAALAEALPESLYDWRPGEGVFSVREALLHVAAASFLVQHFVGIRAPAELFGDLAAVEGDELRNRIYARIEELNRTITAKAEVVAMLHQSFASALRAFEASTDQEMGTEFTAFGRTRTRRAAFLRVLVHMHEHMGQLAAYARVNGIAPPWPVKQAQAERA